MDSEMENEELGQSGNDNHFEPKKMLPPPAKTFQSREELLDYVAMFSFAQGYATSIKDSKKNKYVRIGCDTGGTYRNKMGTSIENRKRKSSSRLINCPFEVRGNKQFDESWILRTRISIHNHEPSDDMSAHPLFRQFTEEERARIKEMVMAGTAPKQIMTSLRQANPNLQANSRSLYTTKEKIRKENLRGRSPIHALLDELSEGGFTHNLKCDAENRLTHLFLAHPISINLSRTYSNVFVMDCTYKTNKFKMPLLDIVGVTSLNTSFYSCFTFLRKEEEEDYVWALSMFKKMLGFGSGSIVFGTDRELALMKVIHVVFPTATHLLCVWHIEKNVLAKCEPRFEEDEDWKEFLRRWSELIHSPTESDYNAAWKEIEADYKHKVVVITYIKSTWLIFKEKFVTAWTNKYLHFGNHASLRAEGAHAKLKGYLQVSTGDLYKVKESICLAIENDFKELKTQVAIEKTKIPHNVNSPFFKELFHRVSLFALDKLFKQYKSASSGQSLDACKGHFYATTGLPCAHMMKAMGNGLRLSDVHSQWKINELVFDVMPSDQTDTLKSLVQQLENEYQKWPTSRREDTEKQLHHLINDASPIVFEPIVQPHRGRPLGSKAKKVTSLTTRDPSEFEHVTRKKRHCSICGGTDHTRQRCPQNIGDRSLFVAPLDLDERESTSHMLDLNSMPDDVI